MKGVDVKHSILSICILVFFAIGCKTGGVRIGKDSAGKIIKPKTVKEINEGSSSIPKGNPAPDKPIVESVENIPNGNVIPKKEEAASWDQATSLPNLKVEILPAKSRPVIPDLPAAEPETDNFDLALKKANLKLSKFNFDDSMLPDLPLGDKKDNIPLFEVVPAPDLEEDPKEKSENDKAEKRKLEAKRLSEIEKENMKINFGELILFYFLALMILIIAYITYDFIREMKKQAKEKNPFVKKPVKKNAIKKKAPKKAVKKKAPEKKKPAKKKAVKKTAKKKAVPRKK